MISSLSLAIIIEHCYYFEHKLKNLTSKTKSGNFNFASFSLQKTENFIFSDLCTISF